MRLMAKTLISRSVTTRVLAGATFAVLAGAADFASAEPPTLTPKPADRGAAKGAAAGDKAAVKGLAVAQPRTPAEREKALANLYAHLATAADASQAKTVAEAIERLWHYSGSDTVAVLMERAVRLANDKKFELALKLLDAVVDLAPDHAEAWNKRASVHFQNKDLERALGDLRRVLALDANHYRALDALGHILKDIGQKKGALSAMRRLADVYQHWDGLKQAIEEMSRDVDGQSL